MNAHSVDQLCFYCSENICEPFASIIYDELCNECLCMGHQFDVEFIVVVSFAAAASITVLLHLNEQHFISIEHIFSIILVKKKVSTENKSKKKV